VTAALIDDEVRLIDSLPTTTPLRTVCDLLSEHHDGGHIGTIIRQAVLTDLVALDDLANHLGPHAWRYGVRRDDGLMLLEHLLAVVGTTIAELANRPVPPQRTTSTADAAERTR
jgi:hypothetical protein